MRLRILIQLLTLICILPMGAIDEKANVVATDRDGIQWIGTDRGLCRYDGKQYKYFDSQNDGLNAAPRRIENIVVDGSGNLWIKTVDHKLYIFNPSKGQFNLLADDLKPYSPNIQVIKIQGGPDGGVLILTKVKNLLLGNSDKSGGIRIRLLVDAREYLEPGTDRLASDIRIKSGGYDCYVGRDYTIYCQSADSAKIAADTVVRSGVFSLVSIPASGGGIRSICEMPDGKVWLGGRDKNIYITNAAGKVEKMLDYPTYHIGSVYHIMRDSEGRVWLSSKGDGLTMISGDSVRHFLPEPGDSGSICGKNVYMTYEDSLHRLWVCTLDGGLNMIGSAGGNFVFYNKNNGFVNYPSFGQYTGVRNIIEDPEGRLWIGTTDGLMSIQPYFESPADMIFDTYHRNDLPPLVNRDIYSLYSAPHHLLWIGSDGFGLSELAGFDLKEGLPLVSQVNDSDIPSGTTIISMVIDKSGRLWMISQDALYCRSVDGDIYRLDSKEAGLDVHFEESSCLCSSDGKIWIGCREGILQFDPDAALEFIKNQNSGTGTWTVIALIAAIIVLIALALYLHRRRNAPAKEVALSSPEGEPAKEEGTKPTPAEMLMQTREIYKNIQSQKDSQFITEVETIINRSLTNDDLNIDNIAAEVGLSRSTFFKRIKTLTGLSPQEYLKDYKMNRAIELMKTTDMTIAEIAYNSGFKDSGYFGKCFRKEFGISPREFLNEIRK